ncbi:hypothetical protein E2C01_102842 [Portunus trituberculatus]|uniref:Uncharacterized protein n=1 Tax=Portunus trituberculatus TaxID=210409 RepID=A0A5B7KDL7_PORTR|nr:hypothetical protein [Portunus trituberculatus]
MFLFIYFNTLDLILQLHTKVREFGGRGAGYPWTEKALRGQRLVASGDLRTGGCDERGEERLRTVLCNEDKVWKQMGDREKLEESKGKEKGGRKR